MIIFRIISPSCQPDSVQTESPKSLKKEPTKKCVFFVSTKFITQCFLDPPTTQDFNLSLVYFLGK